MKPALATRIHPAARLAALAAALVALTAFNDPIYVAALGAVVVFAAAAVCRAGRALARSLPLALTFIVVSLALWPPFIAAGDAVLRVAFYRATDVGLRYGLAVGLRVVAMFAAGAAFLAATTPEEFASALRAYRVPGPATVTITLAFRLLPVMFETTSRAEEAQRARGMPAGRNFFSQTREVIPLVVPVFLYTLRSADQLAVTLELRGYRAGRKPALYNENPPSVADWFVGVGAWLAAAGAVAARLSGWGAALPGRL
jgi:energy-coupling factor transport system permease protein